MRLPEPLVRGVVGSVLTAVGGTIGASLPEHTPILAIVPLEALRAHEGGRMLGLLVTLTGLGLLGSAWLSLGQRGVALPVVRRAALLWSLPFVVAPPLFSNDGWSYAAIGAMVDRGYSPYDFGPWVLGGPLRSAVDPLWLFTPSPYGPLPIALGGLLARITDSPWLLVIGHRLIALLGLALLAWAVPRLAVWSGIRPERASAVVLISPLMLTSGVAGLHNDLLMTGLMAAALVVGLERHWLAGVALGATAAAVKVPGGLVCVVIALATLPVAAGLGERLRRLVAAGGCALAVLVGLGLVSGLGLGWVGGLSVPASINTPLSLPTLVGGFLDLLAHPFGGPSAYFLDRIRGLASLATLALVGWLALRMPTGSRAVALRWLAFTMTVVLALLPVVHLWYLLWPLPFLAVTPLPRLATRWLLAVVVIAGLVAPLDPSLHGAYLAILTGVLLVALGTVVLLVRAPARQALVRIADRHRIEA